MTGKIFKHNLKVYMQSVMNAMNKGGYYVTSWMGESPYPKIDKYMLDEAQRRLKKYNTTKK